MKNLQPKHYIGIGVVILVILIIVFVVTGDKKENIENSSDNWKEVVSKEHNFKILFPADPIYTTNDTDQSKEDTYSITYNDIYYDLTIMVYPDEANSPDPRNMIDMLISSNTGVELLSLKDEEFQGYEVIDFVTKDNYDFYMDSRIISIGKTFYLLMVEYLHKNVNEANYKKFIDSFQLIEN